MEISNSTETTMKAIMHVNKPHAVGKIIESMKEAAIKERMESDEEELLSE
jgi:hypothetical protein